MILPVVAAHLIHGAVVAHAQPADPTEIKLAPRVLEVDDPDTLLTKWVKKHVVGTPSAQDALVYEEHDDSFYMGIGRTRDDQFICIGVDSTVSSATASVWVCGVGIALIRGPPRCWRPWASRRSGKAPPRDVR